MHVQEFRKVLIYVFVNILVANVVVQNILFIQKDIYQFLIFWDFIEIFFFLNSGYFYRTKRWAEFQQYEQFEYCKNK